MTSDAPVKAVHSRATSSSELRKELDQVLDVLIRDTLPTAPYILRLQNGQVKPIPQPAQQCYWRAGTHFAEDEEELNT